MASETIVVRLEDVPVRKKMPPPAKTIRDPKAYRRNPKHKNRDNSQDDEKAPGRDNPPGASHL
ncbi:MAG: hypothetical protein HY795_18445 [Desulfovibrio sp.]|nr:hypothetical protein [Desulfovibrio sp.]MBI4960671.1 hypothetical protein [Desulfovibrio sp.]